MFKLSCAYDIYGLGCIMLECGAGRSLTYLPDSQLRMPDTPGQIKQFRGATSSSKAWQSVAAGMASSLNCTEPQPRLLMPFLDLCQRFLAAKNRLNQTCGLQRRMWQRSWRHGLRRPRQQIKRNAVRNLYGWALARAACSKAALCMAICELAIQ
jgi:hypothetical protein